MKRFSAALIVILALFALAACQQQPAEQAAAPAEEATVEKAAHDCEACAKGEAGETAWCEGCNMGFVKGEKVACKDCYGAATAELAGWCETCGVGFVKGEKVACKGCIEAAIAGTECAACAAKKTEA